MSNKIERLLRIYNRLRRGPVTVDMLHRWTIQAGIEVSTRQLHRDLLELCSLQLNEDEKVIMENLGEKNQKVFKLIHINADEEKLSDYDLNTYSLLRAFAPWSIIEARKPSLEKIDALLYKQISSNKTERTFKTFSQSRNSHFYEYLHSGEVQEKIECFIWAINNNRQLLLGDLHENHFLFHKRQGAFQGYDRNDALLINPICLLHHRGEICCCFTLAETNEFWRFTISEHFSIEVTNNTFNRKTAEAIFEAEMAKRFGVHEIIDNEVFDIVLQVNPQICNFFEHFFWHSTQKFKQEHGFMLMTMRCGISIELIGWLGLWLDQVKVLQPFVLQQKMVEQTQKMLSMYKQGKPPGFDTNLYTQLK